MQLALQKNGLKLVRFEGAEPFEKRIKEYQVDKSLKAIAKSIVTNSTNIEFSKLHTYD